MVGQSIVGVKGLNEVKLYFKNVIAKTPKKMLRLTETLARVVRDEAKAKVAPLDSGTGELRDSIVMKKEGDGFIVEAGRGLKRPYAYFQEFGYFPHFVSKKKWMGPRPFGKSMYVQQFFPFLSKGFRKALRKLPSEMNRTANKIVRG